MHFHFHHIAWTLQQIIAAIWIRVVCDTIAGFALIGIAITKICLAVRKDNCFGKDQTELFIIWCLLAGRSLDIAISLQIKSLFNPVRPSVVIFSILACVAACWLFRKEYAKYHDSAEKLANDSIKFKIASAKGVL